jgi:uncharacterized protein (DUF2164 family)
VSKDARQAGRRSIERYFRENMDEPMGKVAAAGLFGFLLEEIGPSIYNKAVADLQERMQMHLSQPGLECARRRISLLAQAPPAGRPRK